MQLTSEQIQYLKEWFPYIVIAILCFRTMKPTKKTKQENNSWDNYYKSLDLIEKFPYYKQAILSNRQKKEYKKLKEYTDSKNILVFPKVHLKHLVRAETETFEKEKLEKFISVGWADFVVCNQDLEVIVIVFIEIETTPKSKAAKDYITSILSGAGYRVIFTPEITEEILKKI